MEKILFIGGDERNTHVYDSVKNKLDNVDIIAFKENDYDKQKMQNAKVIVFPILASKDSENLYAPLHDKEIKLDAILEDFKKTEFIIGGKLDRKIKDFAIKNNIGYFEYIEEENFKSLNAIPTAEAALAIAVFNTKKTLWNSKCLVTGYGSIGKYLCFLLTSFGADVTATARKESDFNELKRKSIKYIETSKIKGALNDFDIIFNTIPHRIFDDNEIKNLDEDKLLIDLASAPYGLEHSLNYNKKWKESILG